MIVGVGVDVCSLSRWRAMADRRPSVIAKLLTAREAELGIESQAARFAAKEALAKALQTNGTMHWHDCEVVVSELGAPSFAMTGTVAARAAELGITHVHLSLSHDAGAAAAFVVAERR